ncbi:MAG: glycoside hydrolase family 11 protein, partial [Oscillospiraceae bacterium]|nr:glycoside hydrolase family 11 protein [Oscillospiraceae bacterium]
MLKRFKFNVRRAAVVSAALFLLLSWLPPVSRAEGETLLIGFEDGTLMGFDVRGTAEEKAAGTGVLTVVTEEAHSGQYSLLITDRRQSWNGPAFNVAPLIVPGSSCEISVWVLVKSPDSAPLTLSTQIGEGAAAEYINLQSKSVSKAGGWTELTGQYTYGGADFITVYVESGSTATEFYIDDFSFSMSEPEEPYQEWDPETDPLTNNKRGEYDGFDFEFWSQRPDQGSMMLTGGGTFECSWDAFNILFRTGKKLGSTQTYAEYGEVVMDYGALHNITRGDVSYLCVYGWTEDPMIEFYIIENHGSYKPPGGKGYQGDYSMDGSMYEVYVDTRVNQPSIQGTQTFEQYFAVRTDLRTEGTISISEHFKAWEALGLD